MVKKWCRQRPNKLTLSQVGSSGGSTMSGAFFLPFFAFGGILRPAVAQESDRLQQQDCVERYQPAERDA